MTGTNHPGHRRKIAAEKRGNHPTPRARADYFFLLAAAFAFVACCDVMTAWFETFVFDCFCDACFCTDFGDLSPMMGIPFVELPHLRNVRFPEGVGSYPGPAGA
jgi:hypothetical protein